MDYSPRYRQFRALLRRIREEAGLSQTELAHRLGRPQSFVSKSELGERRVDALEIADFCAACEINLPTFFRRLDKLTADTETQRHRRPRRLQTK